MKSEFAKKAIIQPQLQFKFGSNIYETDVKYIFIEKVEYDMVVSN